MSCRYRLPQREDRGQRLATVCSQETCSYLRGGPQSDRRSGEYGAEMSEPTRSVLSLLATTCPSQRELASALRVTPQTMSATLERLEQLEHVERSRDHYDRLRSLCRLTEKDRLAPSEVDTDESPLLDDDRRDELLRQLLIELITRHPDRDGVDAHNAIADHE